MSARARAAGRRWPVVAWALAGLAVAGSGLRAQTLEGHVLDEATGDAIAGALVTLADLRGGVVAVVTTGDDGAFTFTEPDPPGRSYELRVEQIGYGPARARLQFSPGRPLQVDVLLAPAAIPVDSVVVSTSRSRRLVEVGFEARREAGGAIYIDRTQVEERSATRVTDLLRGQPGVRVISFGSEEDIRVGASGRNLSGSDCQPAVWIDGSRVRSAGAPDVDQARTGSRMRVDPALTELVSPDDIEGIEVYTGPAGLPVQFRDRNADCGVVLIWTRTT